MRAAQEFFHFNQDPGAYHAARLKVFDPCVTVFGKAVAIRHEDVDPGFATAGSGAKR